MRLKVKQSLMFSCCLIFSLLFFFWFHVRTINKPAFFSEKLKELLGKVGQKSYLENCLNSPKWNSTSKWPPVEFVANKLSLKNGESVFVNGIEHCGIWLQALHSKYPKSTITAVDVDVGAIENAKRDLNFTADIAAPHDLLQLNLPQGTRFDHGLTEDSLSGFTPERQCSAIRQMLPLIKAGGSIYIGHNYEKCAIGSEENVVEFHIFMKKRGIQPLPTCFWSSTCLNGRSDVYEVLYDNEHGSYDSQDPTYELKSNPCRSSVFIYKHVQVSKDKHKDMLLFASKFRMPWARHRCSHSSFTNETRIDKVKSDRESIKGALINVKPWLDV